MPKDDQPEAELLTAEEAAHLKATDSGYVCNMSDCRFHRIPPPPADDHQGLNYVPARAPATMGAWAQAPS